MVDFLKIGLSYKYASILLKNINITWEGAYNYNTGEIYDYPLKGKFYNFEIIIKKSKVIISGSLHIYYNLLKRAGKQNYDDFSITDLQNAVTFFSSQLQISPQHMKLENVEIGVNIPLTINVSYTLKNLFIDWNGRTKCVDKVYRNGHLVEFKTAETFMKFYDKGCPNNLPYQLLRVEIKFMRNEILQKKAHISTLEDLTDRKKIGLLIQFFSNQARKINIIDNLLPPVSLTGAEKTLFDNGTNPMFWANIDETDVKIQKSKYRIEYFSLIKKLGLCTISTELTSALKSKINALNS